MAVVGELVVAGKRDQTPEAGAEGVEYLGGGVSPDLGENRTVKTRHL